MSEEAKARLEESLARMEYQHRAFETGGSLALWDMAGRSMALWDVASRHIIVLLNWRQSVVGLAALHAEQRKVVLVRHIIVLRNWRQSVVRLAALHAEQSKDVLVRERNHQLQQKVQAIVEGMLVQSVKDAIVSVCSKCWTQHVLPVIVGACVSFCGCTSC
jgi:hypothetical protein